MSKQELTIIDAKEYGIEEKTATEITKGLAVTISERDNLIKEFAEVSKLPINEENISIFKELRLRIRDNRTKGLLIWHKTNKEYFLRGGQFVDAIKRREELINTQMEDKLMEGEKHFEKLEQERLDKLQSERAAKLLKYIAHADEIDLKNMDADVFEAYLAAKKSNWEQEQEAAKKAEQERLENERLDELAAYRNNKIMPLFQYYTGNHDLRTISDNEFEKVLEDLKQAKANADAEQLRIKQENARLVMEQEKRELAEKAKAATRAKRTEEMRPYIVYIRDYDGMLNLPEKEYQKALSDVNRAAVEEMKFKAEQDKKAEAQRQHQEQEEKKRVEKALEEKQKKYIDLLLADGYVKQSENYFTKSGYGVSKDTLGNLSENEFKARLKEVNINIANAKKQAEEQAKADAEAQEQARLNQGDAGKIKTIIEGIEGLKAFEFKAAKNVANYKKVCALLDEAINTLK